MSITGTLTLYSTIGTPRGANIIQTRSTNQQQHLASSSYLRSITSSYAEKYLPTASAKDVPQGTDGHRPTETKGKIASRVSQHISDVWCVWSVQHYNKYDFMRLNVWTKMKRSSPSHHSPFLCACCLWPENDWKEKGKAHSSRSRKKYEGRCLEKQMHFRLAKDRKEGNTFVFVLSQNNQSATDEAGRYWRTRREANYEIRVQNGNPEADQFGSWFQMRKLYVVTGKVDYMLLILMSYYRWEKCCKWADDGCEVTSHQVFYFSF